MSIARDSNTDNEFWYFGIELNTEFRYWKLGNACISEAKNGHLWQILLKNYVDFEAIANKNTFRKVQ